MLGAEGLEHPLQRLLGAAVLELGGDRLVVEVVIVGTVPERVMGGGFMAAALDRALPLAALDFVGTRSGSSR